MFFTRSRDFFCNADFLPPNECFKFQYQRQFLYYFYNLNIWFEKNNTQPIDMRVYYINYVPHRAKNEVNKALHRWNQYHAGWVIPQSALYTDPETNKLSYRYYYEPENDNFFFRSKTTGLFENKVGSSGIEKYNGPDCVFNFAGGSTMRNNSCEFWVGLIPDMPFTNYARDIYEEHLAYKSLKDDSFIIDTRTDIEADLVRFYMTEPYHGKFTGLRFQMLFWVSVPDGDIDGEPKCGEFYQYPEECEGARNDYKPVTNIHKQTREFFLKITLPYGITVNASAVGNCLPCFWDAKTRTKFNDETFTDYLCFYWNSTLIYAFNSTATWGFTQESGHWDVALQVDGLYIHENASILPGDGRLEFGFFVTTFFYAKYPSSMLEGFIYYKYNYTLTLTQSNTTNGAENEIIININAQNNFDKDTVFRFDFPDDFPSVEMSKARYNGKLHVPSEYDYLANNNYFSRNSDVHSKKWH